MKINISPARTTAYKILYDVLENKAFSNVSINKNLDLSLKNENDRRLAVNIIYGSLKKRNRLEKIIASLSTIDIKSIDKKVKIILILSLYQIVYLDKIPEYALVNDAVNMCKFYAGQSGASFVNGVLRNALRKKSELIMHEKDFDEYMFYEFGFPKWVTELLQKNYDKAYIKSYAQWCESAPDLFIRVNTLKTSTDILSSLLSQRGIKTESTYVPDTLKVLSNSNIFFTKEYKEGLFYAQDLSGVISGYVLDPQKGDKIIDMCSAPGGKSFNASILSLNSEMLSADINTIKLELVKRSAKQLGLSGIKAVKRDASVLNEQEAGLYDKVICDVPCSGLGVIKRKPEILFNLTQEHVSSLIKLQGQILENGFHYLKKGGTLIYSTCTMNAQENFDQIAELLNRKKNAKLAAIQLPFKLLNKHSETEKGILNLDPVSDQCDGFFMAKITKI